MVCVLCADGVWADFIEIYVGQVNTSIPDKATNDGAPQWLYERYCLMIVFAKIPNNASISMDEHLQMDKYLQIMMALQICQIETELNTDGIGWGLNPTKTVRAK